MKIIKENEFFQVGGTIFQYLIIEGKHKLIPSKKEIKSRPKTPELQEVKDYFKSKGYTEESAIKFHEYYSSNEWKDGVGKDVKNWKQKAIGVWFKFENKIKEITNPTGISFFQ